MAWGDIPRWQNMSKEELCEELIELYGEEHREFVDRFRWLYVTNCYELAASLNQKYPGDCFRMLWPKSQAIWY